MLAWILVKMLTESLLNMLAKSLLNISSGVVNDFVSQNSDKHFSQGKNEYLFNTTYQVSWKQHNYFKVFFKIQFFCGWP